MTGTKVGTRRFIAWAAGAFFFAGSAAHAQILFEDTFDTLGDGVRPPSANWIISGALEEEFWFGDKGALNTGNLDNTSIAVNLAFVNRPEARQWEDVRVSATFQMMQPDGSVLLAVRQQDLQNFYLAKLTGTVSPSGTSIRSIEIQRLQRGLPAILASRGQPGQPTVTIPPFERTGRNHEFQFEAIGNRLVVRLDGAELLSTTDNTFKRGSVGIGASLNQVLFDRVSVVRASTGAGSGAAASAGSGSGNWRILAASGLATKEEADGLLRSMLDPSEAEVVQEPNGWSLYIGRFATKAEAEGRTNAIVEKEGFLAVEVVELVAAVDLKYQVSAGLFDTQAAADSVQERLSNSQGIFMFDTDRVGGKIRLLVGFPFDDQAEARKFLDQIRPDAPNAEVVAIGGQRRAASISVTDEQLSTLSTRDREAARALIDRYNQGNLSAEEQARLDREFRSANEAVQRVIREQQEAQRRAEEAERVAQQRTDLAREVDAHMKQQRWNEAQARLLQLKNIDRDNPVWDRLLNEVQQGIAGARAPRATPAPTLSPGERFEALLQSARAAEQRANTATETGKLAALEEAKRLWTDVQRQAETGAMRDEATTVISRLNEQIAGLGRPPAETGGGGGMLGIVLGGVIGLLVLGGAAFFVLGRKKPAPAPATGVKGQGLPMPSIPTPLPPSALKTPLPSKQTTPSPVPPTSAPTPVPPTPNNAPPPAPITTPLPAAAASPDRILPGAFSPAPEPPSGVLPPVANEMEPFAIPGFSTPVPISDVPAPSSGQVPQIVPPSDPARPVMPSGEVALPEANPALARTPAPTVPPPTSDEFYAQSFDDEEVGAAPRNWRGSYDYANLTIVQRDGGGKCLQFEKRSGSGSAYYACRFPDASGKVVVEFDMKCEDKNKYLLGFYIEKDEDFRHSIHTVVHKDAGKGEKVTIRLQNESAPYTLGEWVHIKFLVDLTRHLVDGYVNDKPVAIGVRLVSRPKVINTLSIRDNLLTEGKLLIDNIRISRER